ncbi:hypothetical protein [Hymenobacter sedentarius]|uniref:hypothetical protein n=1 Tax=Hymenobacter sedentarius TaxID=1411621 RepID=UPI0012FDC46E|nr:hypothetical protein [Hymenobacter sedentarius]
MLTWLRSSVTGQIVRWGLGLLLTVSGYFLWQVVGAVVHFFAFGSGEGHRDQGLVVAASCALLHLGVLSGLAWRRVLYPSGWAWALNAAVVVSLFVHYVFQPWQGSPPDAAYQRYSFAQGEQRYEITLEHPGHWFNLSDVINHINGSTTSLLMGDYQVRHDTIFFREWAGPRKGFIYQRTLVGFMNSSQPILLTCEADITPWSLR